MYDLCIFSVK